METTNKIDRTSFIDVLVDIADHEQTGAEFRPHNPVLVYNHTTGVFDIQSDLLPMHDDEQIISGQLDTSEGLSAFIGDLQPSEATDFVSSMSDAEIINWFRIKND